MLSILLFLFPSAGVMLYCLAANVWENFFGGTEVTYYPEV